MADKYRETAEENRRLYNEVQDLKGNIRVFCRVRPLGATGDHAQGGVVPIIFTIPCIACATHPPSQGLFVTGREASSPHLCSPLLWT
jgi:hypothetical protein